MNSPGTPMPVPFNLASRRRFLQSVAGVSAGLLLSHLRGPLAWGQDAPPLRDGKKLKVLSADPLNAEPPLDALMSDWITPIESFYIRTHGNNPAIDGTSYRLSVEGLVERPLTLSLEQLRADFTKVETVATMTCAGNRRSEFNAIKKVGGVQWGASAIGNARWEGVRLSDVLKKAGVKEGAKHIWFEGLDSCKIPEGTTPFGGSIPLEKAMADAAKSPGALLAFGMNGKPLPLDHGFPLRSVVPGYIGARSVKWMGKIVVSDRPSPNHFIQDVYKIVKTEKPAEAARAQPIYEFPINSAICSPATGTKVAGGMAEIRGYALPAGLAGRAIDSVEYSTDGGVTWRPARKTSPVEDYCWVLWAAQIPVRDETTVLVRAVDATRTTQPKRPEWNLKGYLYDGWHRIDLTAGA